MVPSLSSPVAEAVLIVAPTAEDANAAKSVLAENGIAAELHPGGGELGQRLLQGVSILLVAQEALDLATTCAIERGLRNQPEWSDLPLIVLTAAGMSDSVSSAAVLELLPSGNVTLLERPFRQMTLLSAVRMALRARARQHQVRALIESEHRARADSERANRLKDEFLATLSHELRTPLNAILGWAQLLRRAPVDAESVGQGMEVIERSARLQAQLVSDLLDMSRIVSGKLRLELQPVQVGALIDQAVESVRPTAEAQGIALECRVEPDVPQISGDPARLQQVIWNLLSNAVKFTPREGRVRVHAYRIGGHVEVTVCDTGKGIDPEFLPYVFDRFRQADSSSSRKHGGLGLGLSIVKQLVEMHGGAVKVDSLGEGRGATFTVVLPISSLSSNSNSAAESGTIWSGAPATRPDLSGMRVLVVDDEPDAREVVKRILEFCGAEVAAAGSVADGLELLGRFAADVIVSDISMPGQDGYQFVQTLRAAGHDVPAVALTAFVRPEDRARVLRAGYQMHVSKPVEAAELISVVARLAQRGARRDRGAGVMADHSHA